MTKKRNRTKPTLSLDERISAWASGVRAKAAELPPGPERDELLKKIRQADEASRLADWYHSPALRAPT